MKTQRGSTSIRPATREDIPQLVDLCRQVLGGGKLEKTQELAEFYENVLFNSPWQDDKIQSLASVDRLGRHPSSSCARNRTCDQNRSM